MPARAGRSRVTGPLQPWQQDQQRSVKAEAHDERGRPPGRKVLQQQLQRSDRRERVHEHHELGLAARCEPGESEHQRHQHGRAGDGQSTRVGREPAPEQRREHGARALGEGQHYEQRQQQARQPRGRGLLPLAGQDRPAKGGAQRRRRSGPRHARRLEARERARPGRHEPARESGREQVERAVSAQGRAVEASTERQRGQAQRRPRERQRVEPGRPAAEPHAERAAENQQAAGGRVEVEVAALASTALRVRECDRVAERPESHCRERGHAARLVVGGQHARGARQAEARRERALQGLEGLHRTAAPQRAGRHARHVERRQRDERQGGVGGAEGCVALRWLGAGGDRDQQQRDEVERGGNAPAQAEPGVVKRHPLESGGKRQQGDEGGQRVVRRDQQCQHRGASGERREPGARSQPMTEGDREPEEREAEERETRRAAAEPAGARRRLPDQAEGDQGRARSVQRRARPAKRAGVAIRQQLPESRVGEP